MTALVRMCMLALLVMTAVVALSAGPAFATVTGAGNSSATLTLEATTPATGTAGSTFSATIGGFLKVSTSCVNGAAGNGFAVSGTIDANNAAATGKPTFTTCTCTIGGKSSVSTVTTAGNWSLQSSTQTADGKWNVNVSIASTTITCTTPAGCSITVPAQTLNSGTSYDNTAKRLASSAAPKNASSTAPCGVAVSTFTATFTASFVPNTNKTITIS